VVVVVLVVVVVVVGSVEVVVLSVEVVVLSVDVVVLSVEGEFPLLQDEGKGLAVGDRLPEQPVRAADLCERAAVRMAQARNAASDSAASPFEARRSPSALERKPRSTLPGRDHRR